jgi:hypothetical protein
MGALQVDSKDLKVLAKELSQFKGENLVKELHDGLRKAALPVVPDMRAAIMAIPSKGVQGGGRSTRIAHKFARASAKSKANPKSMGKFQAKSGLRQAIAAAVQVSVSATGGDVSIRVNGSAMPEGQRGLPFQMDGGRPWKHPIFGIKGTSVSQEAHPFFDGAIISHIPRIEQEVNVAMDRANERLAKGV